MKKTIIATLLAVATISVQGQVKYRLEGNIGQNYTGTMYIRNQSGTNNEIVDSVEVVNGNITAHDGSCPKAFLGHLGTKNFSLQLAPVFIDKGVIRIDMQNGAPAIGTPLNNDWTSLYRELVKAVSDYRSKKISEADAKAAMDKSITPMLKAHSADALGYLIVTQFNDAISSRRGLEYIAMLSSDWQRNDMVKRIKADLEKRAATEPGAKFIDFAVEYNGKTTRLSDYVGRGQYVLADFWASWCGPCRQEIPNIKAAYSKYKDRGLQVIGIAAWDEPKATLKAIAEEQIEYPQIINSQKIATDIYGISGIPEIILFGPDGTIIARGLRGQAIGKMLAEIFDKNE